MTKLDDGNKVTMHETDINGASINRTFHVIWDMQKRCFKINREACTERTAPFMSITEAHRTIVECFDLVRTTANVPSKPIKVVDAHLPTTSGTYKLLEHIKRVAPLMPKTATGMKVQDVNSKFEGNIFGATTNVFFKDNWPLTTVPFSEWAKNEPLETEPLGVTLGLQNTQLSSKETLRMEQDTRQEVVLLLSIIFLLEMLGDKLDEFPEEDKKEINVS